VLIPVQVWFQVLKVGGGSGVSGDMECTFDGEIFEFIVFFQDLGLLLLLGLVGGLSLGLGGGIGHGGGDCVGGFFEG
jgi:hypothetical protein